jgi:FixJ family two-component response regulator
MYYQIDVTSVGANAYRPSAPPVVFIIDDDVSVRESLEALMHSAGWQAISFASATEFLAHPRVLVPSCLMLDVALPDLSGLELQRLLANRTELPMIFITGFLDVPTTVQAMKSGAIEFLMKPFSEAVLLRAVKRALELSSTALSEEAETQVLRAHYASLSPRESEVMALVVAGLPNKQIGRKLSIAEITVKIHRGRVMRKMGARSLPELVRMAARLGLASGKIRSKSHYVGAHRTPVLLERPLLRYGQTLGAT